MIRAYIGLSRHYMGFRAFIERNVCDLGFRVQIGPLRFGVFRDV